MCIKSTLTRLVISSFAVSEKFTRFIFSNGPIRTIRHGCLSLVEMTARLEYSTISKLSDFLSQYSLNFSRRRGCIDPLTPWQRHVINFFADKPTLISWLSGTWPCIETILGSRIPCAWTILSPRLIELWLGGLKNLKIPYDLENRIFQSWSDSIVWYTIRRVSASAFQICFQT